ncbi:MAG: aldo/keto reductase [Anaerolineae bacterium]
MEKRVLGQTGERLSVVGFGGIVVRNETPQAAAEYVAKAIERGINYFDVAPSYGNAEERLGPALEPYRDQVFLACKTERRDREGAEAELRASLRRLRTDHVDLYQFHAVKSLSEVEEILGPGGAMEAFLDAREQGLIRYIGFSAHSEEAALAMMNQFQFDSVLFPFNWVAWYRGGFGPRVLQQAQDKGVGVLALKALAKRKLEEGEDRPWAKSWYAPVESYEEARWGLRFTLSLPVTAAVSPGHAELLWWMVDAAEELEPLSESEQAQLAQMAGGLTPIFPQVYA